MPEPQPHPDGAVIELLPADSPLGFATRGHPYTQPILQNCENWWPGTFDLGSLEVVPGFAPIGVGPGGQGRLTMIAYGEKASTQTRRYFVSGNSSTWLITADGTATEVKTGLTSDTYHTVVSFGDMVLFFPYDGVTLPYKYDFSSDTSSAVTDIGLTQPDVSASIAATNGEGDVKGVVKYFCAYMSGSSQLALSEAFGEIDAGDGATIDLSSLPISGGMNRWIFRTRANGEQPYFAGSIDDGTTTTFTDELQDFELGFPPVKHGQPPVVGTKYAVVYNNRVYVAGANNYEVGFSDINQPQSYNLFSFFNVGGKDGDEVSGLAKIRGAILVFKKNHVYKIAGQDPEVDMIGVDSVRSDDPDSRAVGCPDQSALCGTPDGIFFYYNRQFYMMSNQCTVQPISKAFEDELRTDVNQSAEENILCVYDPNRRIVYASVPTGSSTYPDRTYLYFVDLQAWYKLNVGFTALRVVEIGVDGNPPDAFSLWGHYNKPSVEEPGDMLVKVVQHLDHPTATDFDGDAIVATAAYPPLRFGQLGDVSTYKRGTVTFDVADTSTPLQLTYNFYASTAADKTVSVPLQKTGFTRWTRKFGLGYDASEMELNVVWPGGTKRPVVHGLSIIGAPGSAEALSD